MDIELSIRDRYRAAAMVKKLGDKGSELEQQARTHMHMHTGIHSTPRHTCTHTQRHTCTLLDASSRVLKEL